MYARTESEPWPISVEPQNTVTLPLRATTVRRANHTFHVRIATRRPTDEICAQVLAPFEKTIELDTTGLPTGVYMVEVNGVTDTFAL